MSKEILITLVGALFASTGFWTFFNSWLERKTRKRSATEEGVLALLHDKIYYLCEKHITSGSITVEERENMEYLTRPYFKLHGNGVCEQLYTQVKKLPIKGDAK